MNIPCIIICLNNSKNISTIEERFEKISKNLIIHFEEKHYNSTIGCYNSHIKALYSSIKYMTLNNSDKIIIAEEDLIITNIKYIDNLYKCIDEYNIQSDYILHLGGFPSVNKELIPFKVEPYTLTGKIYLTTAYVVNINMVHKLLNVLNKSSNHIHIDAIIANSHIEQKLVKYNIVNQLKAQKSENTFINNYLSSYNLCLFFTFINNNSFIFFENEYFSILLILMSIYYFQLYTIFIEITMIIKKILSTIFIKKNINQYLNKNIFTFLESLNIIRLYYYFLIINYIRTN